MRFFLSLLSLFVAVSLSAQQVDSSQFEALGLKLEEYYDALKHESLDVQMQECDFLIESTSDPLIRQYVAQNIYDHYIDSPVMGSENVAIHVFDNWFETGEVKMKSNSDLIAAQVFADFNRQSLIGKKAPAIRLESMHGDQLELFGDSDKSKLFRVLYFYDTDCSKCKLETSLLRNLFSYKDYPVEFYAIYAGDDLKAWHSYIKEHLTIKDARHLWDPDFSSDFQRKYGVIQTPRIFLVAPDGTIIGRGLDAVVLEMLLDDVTTEKQLSYGTKESEVLFDGIFSMSDAKPTVGEVKGIADYIHDKTLAAGDTLMFRQMAGDYLYYLSSHSGEGFKEGLKYHIDSNILSADKVWKSSDDSLKVIGFAQIMKDLLSKSAPGSKIADIKVPGLMYTHRGVKDVQKKLSSLKGETNIILFFTEGCEVCAAEKEAAAKLLSTRGVKLFMVNIDDLMLNNPTLASRLMDTFDLSALPYIIMTDKKGVILRRYVSLR